MSGDALVFLAGERALETIRSRRIKPDDVKVVAGAAGGPKWLILGHLDRALFGTWFRERRHPLHLIGSSIGSWRFAAASRTDPVAAIDHMEEIYIHQAYTPKPTPREISETLGAIIRQVLGAKGTREILSHPFNRMNLLAVRGRHLLASDQRLPLAIGLAAAITSNLFRRNWLRYFFQQTLFSDPRDRPPFSSVGLEPCTRLDLTPDNLEPALLASGSIPYLMEGVGQIPHAGGIYRDGGVVDYHLDIPFGLDGTGIVLFPHFSQRIIPGWFDKHLPWRQPSADHQADTLLVAPSERFIARLPNRKITDRNDFYRYAGNDRARFACWKKVTDAGRWLADDFMETMASGRLRHRVKPLGLR